MRYRKGGNLTCTFLNNSLVFYLVYIKPQRHISHAVVVKLLLFQTDMPIRSLMYLWGTIWPLEAIHYIP